MLRLIVLLMLSGPVLAHECGCSERVAELERQMREINRRHDGTGSDINDRISWYVRESCLKKDPVKDK